jgi:hypothetical protein
MTNYTGIKISTLPLIAVGLLITIIGIFTGWQFIKLGLCILLIPLPLFLIVYFTKRWEDNLDNSNDLKHTPKHAQ